MWDPSSLTRNRISCIGRRSLFNHWTTRKSQISSFFFLFTQFSYYLAPHDLKLLNHWDGWGFPGGTVVRNPPVNARDMGLIPGSGRSPGRGNVNPLKWHVSFCCYIFFLWSNTPKIYVLTIFSERDGHSKPPDLPLEKPVCRSGSNS